MLFKLISSMIVETVFLIQLDHKRREMIHEKYDGIDGKCTCFNCLYSAEKRGQGDNRKQNGQTTKASSSAKEEKGLKFVVAPQYEGKTSDLIELGKKLVKEHPEAGKQGEITLYYTGSTYTLDQQEYVVLMLVNKTTTNIDHDAEFKLNWSYDGQSIYQNQLVEYSISENGKLPTQSATIFLLPLTKEQQSIVERITDETKMSLSITDIMMK